MVGVENVCMKNYGCEKCQKQKMIGAKIVNSKR